MTLGQLATWSKEARVIIHINYARLREVYVVIAKKGPFHDLIKIENENLSDALDELKKRVDSYRKNVEENKRRTRT